MRNWILSGSPESWDYALLNSIWGIRENLKVFWDRTRIGDIVIFYLKQPVSGIIGYGKISKKYCQEKAIWTDEINQKKVIYPYKFNIIVEKALPKEKWNSDCIKVNDFSINFRKGINPCTNKSTVDKILKIIKTSWNNE